MTLTLDDRLATLLDKIDEPRDRRRIQRKYDGLPASVRLDAIRNLEDERRINNGPSCLLRVIETVAAIHAICGNTANLTHSHMPQLHAALRHDHSTFRKSGVPVLYRMQYRAYLDAGYDEVQAKQLAETLVKDTVPPITKRPPRQERHRLSRKQRDQVMAGLPHLFGRVPYLLALVTFMISLLIENGGRWEGLQHARIRDIQWRTTPLGRVPVLIIVLVPGKRGKRRIVWRTHHCGKALLAMLALHPCKEWQKHPDAVLMANPSTQDPYGALYDDDLDAIINPIGRHIGVTWRVGPRAFRVYYLTTKSAQGVPKARLRLNVGQGPLSPVTSGYIRYDDDDIVEIGERMGYTQGRGDRTCQCGRTIPRHAPRCPHCNEWLLAEDPATYRLNALARLGRTILQSGVPAP